MASAADARTRTEHSGRLLLRMPRTLHAELARRAETEGVSLNQLIVGALSRSVGAPETPVAAAPSDDQREGAAPANAAPAVAPPLRAALVANLIVVALAAIAAIALLLVAWHRGF